MNRISFSGMAVALVLLSTGERLAVAETQGGAADTASTSQAAHPARGLVSDSPIFASGLAGEATTRESSSRAGSASGWLARVTGMCRTSRRPVAGVRIPLHACPLFLALLDGEVVSPANAQLRVGARSPIAARDD
jgi:hypothetical protein